MLIPLKQGLKPAFGGNGGVGGICLNVDSIKTRIETSLTIGTSNSAYGV